MAKYYGGAKAAKAYPKDLPTKSMSVEMDEDAVIRMISSLAKFLADKTLDNERLIMTVHKAKASKSNGSVPMTFIAGKK